MSKSKYTAVLLSPDYCGERGVYVYMVEADGPDGAYRIACREAEEDWADDEGQSPIERWDDFLLLALLEGWAPSVRTAMCV